MADHSGKRQRLVLVASPLQGHMTPMLQLATYLHSKGLSITIAYCEFNSPDPLKHPGFNFLPLPDNLSGRNPQMWQLIKDNCQPRLLDHLIQMIDDTQEEKNVVIIYDVLMSFAGSVAGNLGIPSIIMRCSCAAFFSIYNLIPQLHKDGRLPIPDSLLQEMIPELQPFRYKDLPSPSLPIQQVISMIMNLITPKTPPSAFIWNTLEFLEPSALTQIRQQNKIPVFAIGPLHKITQTPSTSFLEEDTSCISWLDKQAPKSVTYVSLGSLADMNERVLTEMAWGLANSNQPFLWVIPPSSVKGFEWFEFFPDGLITEMKGRGLIVKWAPQKEVLAHIAVGAFWSHCGWNSTLESISAGVPMLCQPLALDQPFNSIYLSCVWETGLEIVPERGEIESAIRKALVGKEGEEMRNRAIKIQEKVNNAIIGLDASLQNSLNDMVDLIMSL